jgi:hypothetical protein
VNWFRRPRHYALYPVTHRFDDKQFAAVLAAMKEQSSEARLVRVVLRILSERIEKMSVNLDALQAAVASVQADVQNVIAKLNEPDTDAQAKIDAATEALRAVDAALDAIAPDPATPTE